MRFSRTNMRLAASRLPDFSREIDAQAAEFSTTHFCPRNPGLTKSTTYARETAKIGRSLFKSSHARKQGSNSRVLRCCTHRQVLLHNLSGGRARHLPVGLPVHVQA